VLAGRICRGLVGLGQVGFRLTVNATAQHTTLFHNSENPAWLLQRKSQKERSDCRSLPKRSQMFQDFGRLIVDLMQDFGGRLQLGHQTHALTGPK
jgi:acyl-CoA thioesterase